MDRAATTRDRNEKISKSSVSSFAASPMRRRLLCSRVLTSEMPCPSRPPGSARCLASVGDTHEYRLQRSGKRVAYLSLRALRLHLLGLPALCLLLNHAEQRVTSPLQLLRAPALEEPVETEHRELQDVFLDALIDILCLHAVMVQPAQEISVLLFRVNLALRRGVVEFELLHRVSDGSDLLGQQGLEVGTLVPLGLSFLDARLDTGVLCRSRK